MNKLTYNIYKSSSPWNNWFILTTTIYMNGQAVSESITDYATKWAAKRGLNRFCKLLADNVKIVNIGVS